MEKSEIRARGLLARRSLSPAALDAKNRAIRERLLTTDALAKAPSVLSYVSSKDNEVDTLGIIRTLLEEGRPVLVPVVHAAGALRWSRLESLDALVPSRMGILEPAPGFHDYQDVPQEGVCLVPGLAFSKTGQRVGYGGGYFDRFLSVFVGPSIGLAFECQMTESWVPEAHDRPVAMVVTEYACYSPGGLCC